MPSEAHPIGFGDIQMGVAEVWRSEKSQRKVFGEVRRSKKSQRRVFGEVRRSEKRQRRVFGEVWTEPPHGDTANWRNKARRLSRSA